MKNTSKWAILLGLAVLAIAVVPSALAAQSYPPPFGQYWGYSSGWNNYISPPIYLSQRGSDYTISNVRGAVFPGFLNGQGYQPANYRAWTNSPYGAGQYPGYGRVGYGFESITNCGGGGWGAAQNFNCRSGGSNYQYSGGAGRSWY